MAALDRERVQVVLLDAGVGADSALAVAAHAARRSPIPAVLATGDGVTPELAFRLFRHGVAGYVSQGELPASVEALAEAAAPMDLAPHVRRLVGATPLPALFDEVRTVAHEEALARCDGNVARASALLGLSRRAIQKARRGREVPRPAPSSDAAERGAAAPIANGVTAPTLRDLRPRQTSSDSREA